MLEAGDPSGPAVLVHNGTPASGLLFDGWIEDAERRGIRLLGYDRPGYGHSSPHRGRTVADAAPDVSAVADALGIERLAVWGSSGGGPHALACAALLPDRVTAVATLGSVAPYPAEGLDWFEGMGELNVTEFHAALEGREVLEPFLAREAEAMATADAEAIAEALRSLLSPVDHAVITGVLASYFLASTRRAVSGGVEGWLDDDLAFTRPWGFDLERIEVPVQLWHGGEDRFVPLAHGEWIAERIPGVDARISSEEGHLTLAVGRVPDVHAWLLEQQSGVRAAR